MDNSVATPLDRVDSRDRLYRLTLRTIQVVLLAAGIVVATYSLHDVQYGNIPILFGPSTFTKLGLGLFLAAWSAGIIIDTEFLHQFYALKEEHNRLSVRAIFASAAFIATFLLLMLLHERVIVFQAILSLVLIANLFGWTTIRAQIRPAAAIAAQEYEVGRRWGRFEGLRLIDRYVNGRWQLFRFCAMAAMCLLQLSLASAVAMGWGGAPLALPPALCPHLPGLAFCGYVAVSETWMWFMRFSTLREVKLIDRLEQVYRLDLPREDAVPQDAGPVGRNGAVVAGLAGAALLGIGGLIWQRRPHRADCVGRAERE